MDNEIFIRLGIFFLAFAALALLEQVIPRRSEEATKGSRWRTNWSFIIIDSFFLKLLAFAIPLLAIGAALDAKANSIGILNVGSFRTFNRQIASHTQQAGDDVITYTTPIGKNGIGAGLSNNGELKDRYEELQNIINISKIKLRKSDPSL